MVRAEQKRAASGVGVDVGDFPGVASPAANWNGHFKRLHAHERTWTVSAMTALSLNHSATSRKAPVCCSYRIFLSDPKFRRIHHQQDSNMRGKYILFRHFNVM